ncbi:hypothetical protein Csa_015129 [Cucumis sativus]|uniref:Uncharacterized protein n=1 Tax=Cucumis sativus TaxID=3659 RepID=A0A0A0KVM0_CUCSA|nr:hypothetical protein Csa_015129 [Cucumis sativus]
MPVSSHISSLSFIPLFSILNRPPLCRILSDLSLLFSSSDSSSSPPSFAPIVRSQFVVCQISSSQPSVSSVSDDHLTVIFFVRLFSI